MVCPCNPPPFARGQECCKCCPPPRCCGDVVIEFDCDTTTTTPPPTTTTTTTTTSTTTSTTTVSPTTTTTQQPTTTQGPTTSTTTTLSPDFNCCDANRFTVVISGVEEEPGCPECANLNGTYQFGKKPNPGAGLSCFFKTADDKSSLEVTEDRIFINVGSGCNNSGFRTDDDEFDIEKCCSHTATPVRGCSTGIAVISGRGEPCETTIAPCELCEDPKPNSFKVIVSGTQNNACMSCNDYDGNYCVYADKECEYEGSDTFVACAKEFDLTMTFEHDIANDEVDVEINLGPAIYKSTFGAPPLAEECCDTFYPTLDNEPDECTFPENITVIPYCDNLECLECENCQQPIPATFVLNVNGVGNAPGEPCLDCTSFNRSWTAEHLDACTWESQPVDICGTAVKLVVTVTQTDIIFTLTDGFFFASFSVDGLMDAPHNCDIGAVTLDLNNSSLLCDFVGGGFNTGDDDPGGAGNAIGTGKITYARQQQLLRTGTSDSASQKAGGGSASQDIAGATNKSASPSAPTTTTTLAPGKFVGTAGAAGGLTINGIATTQINLINLSYVATGELNTSGTAFTISPNWNYTAKDGIIIDGEAIGSFSEFDIDGNGSITISGTSIAIMFLTGDTSGGLTTSNSANINRGITSVGGIVINSNAELASTVNTFNGSGTLNIGGTVSILRDPFTYIPSGGLTSSGEADAIPRQGIEHISTGGILINGNSIILSPQWQVHISSDGVNIAGESNAISDAYTFTASGGLTVSGLATTIQIYG